MTRQSTATRRVFSASSVLKSIADDLSAIKHEDGLTFADIGRVLGKSEDQAAKYCHAEAEMGVVAFAAMKREWNGRATGSLDRLCEDSRPGTHCDRSALTAVLDAAAKISHMLEDGSIEPQEVREHRKELESARDAIEAQLGKLRAVA